MVSCQKGPTRHAYAWQMGPFWQDTFDMKAPTMYVYCPPVEWNHNATVLPHRWGKSMSVLSPLTMLERLIATLLTNFNGRSSFFQPSISGVLISPIATKAVWHICVACNLPSHTNVAIVAIMTINIRSFDPSKSVCGICMVSTSNIHSALSCFAL